MSREDQRSLPYSSFLQLPLQPTPAYVLTLALNCKLLKGRRNPLFAFVSPAQPSPKYARLSMHVLQSTLSRMFLQTLIFLSEQNWQNNWLSSSFPSERDGEGRGGWWLAHRQHQLKHSGMHGINGQRGSPLHDSPDSVAMPQGLCLHACLRGLMEGKPLSPPEQCSGEGVRIAARPSRTSTSGTLSAPSPRGVRSFLPGQVPGRVGSSFQKPLTFIEVQRTLGAWSTCPLASSPGLSGSCSLQEGGGPSRWMVC